MRQRDLPAKGGNTDTALPQFCSNEHIKAAASYVQPLSCISCQPLNHMA